MKISSLGVEQSVQRPRIIETSVTRARKHLMIRPWDLLKKCFGQVVCKRSRLYIFRWAKLRRLVRLIPP